MREHGKPIVKATPIPTTPALVRRGLVTAVAVGVLGCAAGTNTSDGGTVAPQVPPQTQPPQPPQVAPQPPHTVPPQIPPLPPPQPHPPPDGGPDANAADANAADAKSD